MKISKELDSPISTLKQDYDEKGINKHMNDRIQMNNFFHDRIQFNLGNLQETSFKS